MSVGRKWRTWLADHPEAADDLSKCFMAAAQAGYMLAWIEAEGQATGADPAALDIGPVFAACGVEMTTFALRVRKEMHDAFARATAADAISKASQS